jgi:hypothetical protein
VATRLLVHPAAGFWDRLDLPVDTERIAVTASLAPHLPEGPLWLLSHGPLPAELRGARPGRLRSAIAHMPVQGRNPAAFADHDRIYAVSGWVRDGLKLRPACRPGKRPCMASPRWASAGRMHRSGAAAATTGTAARDVTACSACSNLRSRPCATIRSSRAARA